ncbi:hypothetical protein [Rhodococcus sovatensis]|uniref:Uncharacterized protein n=1 Tax=Rhodococcus sovatensis TaxID=1805840 RepID=A0ABZ2PLV6_9NOCA
MSQFSWIDRPVPAELGAVAHGPKILAEASGFTVGLRYIVAYRLVLDLAIVVSAHGPESAVLASQFTSQRAQPGEPLTSARRKVGGLTAWLVSPELPMTLRGSNRNPHTVDGHYMHEFSYAIDGRPSEQSLEIELRWDDIGVGPLRTVVNLPPAAELDASIIRL